MIELPSVAALWLRMIAARALPGRYAGARLRRFMRATPVSARIDAARAIAASVARAARYVPRNTCLERSVLLCEALERAGLAGTLHLGVRRDSGAMQAHAWVTFGGVLLNERDDVVAGFAPLEDALQ